MTDEDSEVFEITDFTTASDWERFIAQLEEVIHEWKLTTVATARPLAKGCLTQGKWLEKVETVTFVDFRFQVTYHYLELPDNGEQDAANEDGTDDPVPTMWQDLMSAENDFPARAHCLSRWYGLRAFVVVSPAGTDSVDSESRANLVLSSIAIALNNTGCPVPIFIQVHQKWRKFFFGQCELPGCRTTFEMVHLRNTPQQYSHLAGLLDVFKAKLATPVSPSPLVSVAVRFTYVLHDWANGTWPQQPPDMDSSLLSEIGLTSFGELPFGACEDPVSELDLFVTWPSLSEEMIVDNDVYSDLDPLQAPSWSVRVRMAENAQGLLGDYLSEFVQICRRKESTDQLLPKSALDNSDQDADISQALYRLTEPSPINISSISNVVSSATTKLKLLPEEAPISELILTQILQFLFPDAKTGLKPSDSMGFSEKQESEASEKEAEKADASADEEFSSQDKMKDVFHQFKSAPFDSLTHRLAVCMCIINNSLGGLRAVAHLWQEFVLEMRYRWENNYSLPDLETGSPNLGTCLLHQKLQMLNCCIEKKRAREKHHMSTASSSSASLSSATSPRLKVSKSDCGFSQVKNDTKITKSASSLGFSSNRKSNDTDASKVSKSVSSQGIPGESQVKDTVNKSGAEGSLNDVAGATDIGSKDEIDSPSLDDGDVEDNSEVADSAESNITNAESSELQTKDDATGSEDVNPAGEQNNSSNDDDDDDDDEFYECEEEASQDITEMQTTSSQDDKVNDETDLSPVVQNNSDPTPTNEMDCSTLADDDNLVEDAEEDIEDSVLTDEVSWPAEGRLYQCGDLMLLENPDEPLYIPITQEPAPMTEDMLEEHAQVLTKLGTSPEGATLRARMQSASLLSDMESFKAANPGCTLGDFVRWYSPRDWVQSEVTQEDGTVTSKGELSQRMQIPGNMWVEVWQSSKPVPARRQKRLFNDTKEAEKVLHWLATMRPADVTKRLMPVLLQAAIAVIAQQEESGLSSVQSILDQIISKTTKVSRNPDPDVRKFEELERLISTAEILIARAQSLKNKFVLDSEKPNAPKSQAELDRFASSLMDNTEIPVVGASRGPTGQIIHKMFAAAQRASSLLPDEEKEDQSTSAAVPDFPIPAAKEYILRTTASRPAPWSRPTPQRMFCVLLKDDFRLAGAFSSDTTFQ